MRTAITILLYVIIVISTLAFFSEFFYPSNAFLMQAGGSLLYLIILFITVLILIKVRYHAPAAKLRRKKAREKVNAMNEKEFSDFIKVELCKLLSIFGSEVDKDLRKDLRIPSSEISNTLYDLGVIYAIPVSDEDADLVENATDIIELLRSRKYSN